MQQNSFVRQRPSGLYVALSEETGGKYSLLELTVPPNGGPPPHTHLKEDEGFYVVEGTFCLWVEGKDPLTLKAGEHGFGPRGVQHYFRNVGETSGRLLLVFTPGGCENYFLELEQARAQKGPDLLDQEEKIDRRYGMVINRR